MIRASSGTECEPHRNLFLARLTARASCKLAKFVQAQPARTRQLQAATAARPHAAESDARGKARPTSQLALVSGYSPACVCAMALISLLRPLDCDAGFEPRNRAVVVSASSLRPVVVIRHPQVNARREIRIRRRHPDDDALRHLLRQQPQFDFSSDDIGGGTELSSPQSVADDDTWLLFSVPSAEAKSRPSSRPHAERLKKSWA